MSDDHSGFLTFTINNELPVSVDDLSRSLSAFSRSYEDYVSSTGKRPGEIGLKLYVQELRTGSVIAVLQALADQAHLMFGEHGIVPTIQSTFEHADTIAGFLGNLDELMQFFLGKSDKKGGKLPSKKETEQIIEIVEPAAKDPKSSMVFQFNGPINISGPVQFGDIIHHYSSQEANAIQNSARRFLGPSLPTNRIMRDELLILDQVRGDPKAKTGDKGIIESVSKSAVKLLFTSENIKKGIVEAPANPFQQAFIVDVEVKTANEKPALYKILELKDSFEKP